MRHDLIGFLLDAIDDAERDAIRQDVERDPELQQQLEQVRQNLERLQPLRTDVEPPASLAQRTCQILDQELSGDGRRLAVDRFATDATGGAVSPAGQTRRVWGGNGGDGNVRTAERHWTLPDFVVAAGVCLAAACLFFPAIVNSRYHSQLASCQNNQRQLGTALIDYSGVTGGYFPKIPAEGKLSVAGIYAPKLADKGLVRDSRVFLCPAKGSTVVLKIPPLTDIAAARGTRLVKLQRQMGGDYAYTLGFIDKGRLQGIRNKSRATSALLADSPLENTRNAAIGTHGRGQNVLFEDGHVEFLATRFRPGIEGQDDLFFNDEGLIQAGLHSNDAVLAPSQVSPLPWQE